MRVDYDEIQDALVQGLRRRKERTGETFAQLAELLGVKSSSRVSNWVNDEKVNIPGPMLTEVAALLGLELSLAPSSSAPSSSMARLTAAASRLEGRQLDQVAALVERIAEADVDETMLEVAGRILGLGLDDIRALAHQK